MTNLQFFSSLKVAGNCNRCKDRIESKLRPIEGIYSAEWDLASQILKIQYDHEIITVEAIKMIVLKLGHDIDGALAPDTAYKKLPLSCRYRSINHN
ncbi:heavy-metal-associated domain-containing protein [Flavilitoribacter nigricans]|jgi:Cu(I)/Ag(I) efflux system membrane fusion protein|uniref:Cation-transporting ATPase n=1 Tax=Flavilitoribacter nigricans (strain ATCC 23147 / DSM 23189 / NBRC 102662 / NCIMB 1420 / SS-2) TaxID=1122177 RepID=A0A2D0N2B5_FLAN2|nr:cation-transporting ATPase [Flavilitoribacter nigricans DSM 23189 = NBRC 102662]